MIHLHETGTLLNDSEESLGEVIEQREFITSQDPQDLVLLINLFGLLFLQSVVCQYFYFILLRELGKKKKKGKVKGFALGYLGSVAELGTKPF